MNAEQAALLRKASASLQAARLLADQNYPEFSVSRAYYAMFYVAQALLLGEGLSFSKHSAVIAAFGKEFAKPGRVPAEFHRYLIEGQTSRAAGDYEAVSGFTKEEAFNQMRRAERFLELAEELLGQVPPL